MGNERKRRAKMIPIVLTILIGCNSLNWGHKEKEQDAWHFIDNTISLGKVDATRKDYSVLRETQSRKALVDKLLCHRIT